ncbi:hypothetical protein [Mesotoga sp. H07.pep.5.3]|uniref:hypothetical protein n=1 Tax=Mesotoga sp. H07.pep.5.3 TaxID=1421003 RepID=UPI000C17D05B|nr:hypothetical protein [Mesotoga sp. H07.pep.5.3]PIJ63175.1 hypothetical protein V513_02265 [Mesotoga sp. H07.pep.5.3]
MKRVAYISFVLLLLVVLTGCPRVNKKPVASNVRITGQNKSGQMLHGEYDFYDPEQDQEGASKYNWYRSEKADGTGLSSIVQATSSDYKLTVQDVGKYIYFEVTPVDIKGKIGDPVISQASSKIVTGPSFEILDVTVNNGSLAGITVKGHNLGNIDAFEVVIEFDNSYLTCTGTAQSLVGGLMITRQPEDTIIHVAVAGLEDIEVQDTELLRIFFNVLDKVGKTEIEFSEYLSEGSVRFSTDVIPEVEGLDLSDTGIVTVE